MNKITLLQIALLCSLFSFAQNIDTTKYQKVNPGDTIRNYYDQNNQQQQYQQQQNQQQNQQPSQYQPDKSYPYRNQKGGNNNRNPNQQQPANNDFKSKLYYGAYVYFTGGSVPGASVIYYELSPHVGYKITKDFSAGLQILYNNSVVSGAGQTASYSVIGGGAFARYLFPRIPMFNIQFFAQAEYDILAVPSGYLGNVTVKRTASEEKMLGIGIRRNYSKVSVYILFMYDINASYYSPYYENPLVYRLGFSWNW
jgi:hypothetical protein